MQKEACEGVRDINDNSDGYEGAMTAVAKDRTLLAMVGGENREENQVNLATGAEGGGDGGDDWGSVRKAIIAAMALKNGMDPNQTFTVNNETPIPGASNDDGSPYIVDTRSGCRQLNKGEGSCEQSVYEILGVSSNTGAAEMMLTSGSEPTFGADEVYELDRKLGGDIQGEVVPSVVVGSGGGSTKGFANLFVNLTLNEGRAPYREGEEEPEDPFSVDRIYNSEGILVWSHVRDRLPFLEEKQVLDEQVANDTTQLLRAPEEASYGTASNAFNLPSDKVAVKTGSATGGTDVTVAAAMSDSEIGATSEGENGGVAVAWWVGYPNYTNPETGEINRLPEGFSSGDLARIAGIHLTKVGVSDDNSLLPGDSTRVISR